MDLNTLASIGIAAFVSIIGWYLHAVSEQTEDQWESIADLGQDLGSVQVALARVESKADSNEHTVRDIRGDLQKLNDKLDRLLERKP